MASDDVTPLDRFLGFGIVRPFQRDKKNDFASTGGRELVRSVLGQILGTRAQGEHTDGEIVWRQELGSKLHTLKHRKGNLVRELARVYAQEAIDKQEPRIRVANITPTFDRQQRAITLKVVADFIDQNVPGNKVLIPGVEVEVILG